MSLTTEPSSFARSGLPVSAQAGAAVTAPTAASRDVAAAAAPASPHNHEGDAQGVEPGGVGGWDADSAHSYDDMAEDDVHAFAAPPPTAVGPRLQHGESRAATRQPASTSLPTAASQSHPAQPSQQPPWDAAGPEPRAFCCTIDVRSVRSLSVGPTLARVQVRYSYPFLGSSGPVYTAPVEVSRGSEKQFEQSFCSFEFRSTWNDVRATFDSTPILLELLVSDRYVKKQVVGSAMVRLGDLFASDPVATRDGSRIFITDGFVPVRPAEGVSHRKVAEVRVIVTFADRGPDRETAADGDDDGMSVDSRVGEEVSCEELASCTELFVVHPEGCRPYCVAATLLYSKLPSSLLHTAQKLTPIPSSLLFHVFLITSTIVSTCSATVAILNISYPPFGLRVPPPLLLTLSSTHDGFRPPPPCAVVLLGTCSRRATLGAAQGRPQHPNRLVREAMLPRRFAHSRHKTLRRSKRQR